MLCVPWFSVVCCAVTRLCGVVVLCLCAVLCNTAVALWPQSAKFGKILNLGKWHGCLFPDGVGRAAACCVAAGCLLRRLLVAEVARCSRFACFSRFAICCQLPAAAGARPTAVRTTAQPYTADRPTPPRPQNNRSQFTCRLRARRALGGAPRSACAVPSAFGFYCQKPEACQPDVPVPGCPGGCRICNLFRLICNLLLSRRWRTLNFRDIHLRA